MTLCSGCLGERLEKVSIRIGTAMRVADDNALEPVVKVLQLALDEVAAISSELASASHEAMEHAGEAP